jgi:hypothetical protein
MDPAVPLDIARRLLEPPAVANYGCSLALAMAPRNSLPRSLQRATIAVPSTVSKAVAIDA